MRRLAMFEAAGICCGLACFSSTLSAQQTPPAPLPIASVATEGVSVSGSLDVANGKAMIGNNGSITAGDKTATVTLARGGTLRLCSTTTIHLSSDRTITDVRSSALMMAVDRGALEASYVTGKYSDVLMTPDFRILISGPGTADLKLRVSTKGDTCVDNHGDNAPYVTVSSLLDGGVYRVQPNQRVLFEHGSLREVVDKEMEPCGCPPAVDSAVADAASTAHPGTTARAIGGPSSTPADTAFPLAQSEGLAPPPTAPASPVVPAGEVHAQVTVPLVYNSDAPLPPAPASAAAPSSAPLPSQSSAPGTQAAPKPAGFFHHIGHFFSRLFGSGS